MHVQAGDCKALKIGAVQTVGKLSCQMPCFDCSPPVLVFWLWPWPKPGLIRSVIRLPGARSAELLDHVRRAAIDMQAELADEVQRLAIEDVGRIDNRRRIDEPCGEYPAAIARRISPALTASTSTPCRRTKSRIAKFGRPFGHSE